MKVDFLEEYLIQEPATIERTVLEDSTGELRSIDQRLAKKEKIMDLEARDINVLGRNDWLYNSIDIKNSGKINNGY